MSANKKTQGNINISNSSITVGGDIVGGDKFTVNHNSRIESNFVVNMEGWETKMCDQIEQTGLPLDNKNEIKNQIALIKTLAVENKSKYPNKLEKLLNTLAVMSPDIFDVAIATLANPLAGIGLALRKIGNKAKIEVQNMSLDSSQ